MKREIIYRVSRIIIVTIMFLLVTFLCHNVNKNYEEAYMMEDYLLNSLQVKKLNSVVTNNPSNEDSFRLEVSNDSFKNRDITFVANDLVNDDELRIDYKYVNYQIICNGKVVEESVMSEDGVLYKTTLISGASYVYDIKFWISENATDVKGKKFSINITLI